MIATPRVGHRAFWFLLIIISSVLIAFSFSAYHLFAATNLVPNGDLETASATPSIPQGWASDYWGTITPKFTYPVAGDNSAKAARVDVTAYTSGDAKWYFNNITATPGTVYTISDNYMSNVATEVDVDFHLSNGSDTYVYVSAPASSNGAWANFSAQVTAPANTVSMTVFHLIQSVGYVVVDNMSVTNGSAPAAPTCSMSVNPTSVQAGSPSTLTWSSQNATGGTIDNNVGSVGVSGTKSVSPAQTTTYTGTFSGAGGTTTCSATLTVTANTPPPAKPVITSFSANPTSITSGSSTLLSWSVTGASSTSIDNGVGVVTGTSKSVNPTQTTTYTLTAQNPGGTVTATTTVTVQTVTPSPTCSLSANPTSITSGNASTLTWSSQNATGGSIDNNVGAVGTSGTKSVSPTQTTTYTGTFNGAGGTTTCSATVTVTAAPPPPTNLIPNGNLEQGTTNAPTGWNNDYWGSLKATFTYPVTGNGGGKAARVVVTNYSSGDAKWYFDHVAVNSHTIYKFSDDILSNVQANISVEFLMSNGSYVYQWVGESAPSSSWQHYSTEITVPAGAVSMTVLHALDKNGSLTIDNVSLVAEPASPFPTGMVTFTFDDGLTSQYTNARPIMNTAGLKSTFGIITQGVRDIDGDTAAMTWAQIKQLKTDGNEISSHTRTHPFLTQLTATQQQSEIVGSKSDLAAQGLTPTTFIYPYGDENTSIETQLKNAGYIGSRGSYYGLNDPASNRYAIDDVRYDKATTAAQIEALIDQAIVDKRWLVIELHDVLPSGGDSDTITPAKLQTVVNYVKSKGSSIKTVTLNDGFSLLNP